MGNTNIESIRKLVTEYEARREETEEAEQTLKYLKEQRDSAEKALIMAILTTAEEAGVEDLGVIVDGRKYGVKVKEYFTIPKPARDDAYQLLRELGHGDIITERVDDRTLSSEIAGVMEEYRKENPDSGSEYPETYGPLMDLMTRYSKPSLTRIKSK